MEFIGGVLVLICVYAIIRGVWKANYSQAGGAFAVLLLVGFLGSMTDTATVESKPADGHLTPSKEFIWIRSNQRLVAAKLKDPDSAQFGKADRVSYRSGGPVVCGTVNAKNSFGAYDGAQRYIGMGDTIGVYLAGEVQDFGNLWKKICD